jgi:glycosyltransferase involved in cell wall biosynthesis
VAYRLVEAELTAPLPEVALARDEDGVGLVVRRGGRPIGFVLRPLSPGAALGPADVAHLAREAGLLADGVSDATDGAPAPGRLPRLSVVVCTRDRPAALARCLGSLTALRGSAAAAALALEVLVVDNAPSDDRTRAVAAAVPGVRYVRAPVRGLDFARNCALREARGDFVAFFDDDVTVDPGWLVGFAEAWAAHPDAAAVTGPVLPLALETPAQLLFEEYGGFGHRFRRIRWEPARPEDPLYPCSPGRIGAGCNMAVRRDVVLGLGGFDEALDTGSPLPGGGDMDVFYRLLRAGHAIVTEPRCLVFHEHRRSYAELRHQMWTWGLGFMAFVAKSYRTDPTQRPKLRRLVRRWFRQRTWHLVLCVAGVARRPPGLALAQLAGGVVGLLGEYPRSERRVRARLAAAPATLVAPEEAS